MNAEKLKLVNPQLSDLRADDITYSSLEDVQEKELHRFYRRAFPKRADWLCRHWRWLYRLDGSSQIGPILAKAGEVVLGQVALVPFQFRFKDTVSPAAWAQDFAVLPECAPLNLGPKLARRVKALGCPVMGHVNRDALTLFVKRLRMQFKHGVYRLALPLNPAKVLARSKNSVRSASINHSAALIRSVVKVHTWRAPTLEPELLPDDPRQLLDLFPGEDSEPEILRDAEWIRWRLLNYPSRSELHLFRLAGESAIVRCASIGGCRRAHVLWYRNSRRSRKPGDLLAGISSWAARSEIDLLWTVTNDPDWTTGRRMLLPSKLPIIAANYAEDADVSHALASDRCRVHAVDSDFDLIYAE